ncbi:unnamed protein product [Malus baccata var. baccata]
MWTTLAKRISFPVEAPQFPKRHGGVEGMVSAVAVRLQRKAHGGCVGEESGRFLIGRHHGEEIGGCGEVRIHG